jgi:hypothetical protein
MSDERPDVICGISLWQCQRCGFFCQVGKDKYYLLKNKDKEPTLICDNCVNQILKRSKMKLPEAHKNKIANEKAMEHWRQIYGKGSIFPFPDNALMIEIAMKEFFEAGFKQGLEFFYNESN